MSEEPKQYADVTPDLINLLEGIDAKLTTLISLVSDGKKLDGIDAGAILVREAIDRLRK